MSHTEYESVRETAQRLGVTVRAVQKWAAAGKIPGAVKEGRDWRVPKDILGPSEKKETTQEEKFRVALPLLSGAFVGGTALEYIESLEDEDDRAIATGEYYYYTGRSELATEIFEPYLVHPDPSLRYSAEFNSIFCNVSLGRIHLARFSIDALDKQVREGLKQDASSKLNAMGVMTAHALAVLLHQPIPDVPPLDRYLRDLPNGFKLFGCYILAYRAYQEEDYEKALTIADLSLALVPHRFFISMLYCELVAVISLLSLRRMDEAKERFGRMWDIIQKDGFVEIVGEHYGDLQGIVDAYFKKKDPETYERINGEVRRFGANWIKLYNALSGGGVAENLTSMEFTVAMLYNHGWSAQEISSHLDLSEHTVRGYIKTIYINLGINDKTGLAQYMLR